MTTTPVSLLDRSRTRTGEPAGDALRETVERARRADRLGLHRFWVAEHHAVPGIASGSPPLLMAAVAAATTRIRVGSGGVMLVVGGPVTVPTGSPPTSPRSCTARDSDRARRGPDRTSS